MELEERMRPPLSADFHREQRYKSRNLQTTVAGSPNILRSPDEVPNVKILSSLYIISFFFGIGRGCGP
ncbi:hypothetical protein PRIO_1664 [Paenibacillus riograndensis SBR5]|uniref:Uncharacterized protein n=1 Tax=Paenibacillus riograndensis SBR5 TaxID=1073571 RepID=A0A0E4CVE5_9BACL|nr:hypothetical protein PRIO_1664 [Paenibacillus riograndensis SBR5]